MSSSNSQSSVKLVRGGIDFSNNFKSKPTVSRESENARRHQRNGGPRARFVGNRRRGGANRRFRRGKDRKVPASVKRSGNEFNSYDMCNVMNANPYFPVGSAEYNDYKNAKAMMETMKRPQPEDVCEFDVTSDDYADSIERGFGAEIKKTPGELCDELGWCFNEYCDEDSLTTKEKEMRDDQPEGYFSNEAYPNKKFSWIGVTTAEGAFRIPVRGHHEDRHGLCMKVSFSKGVWVWGQDRVVRYEDTTEGIHNMKTKMYREKRARNKIAHEKRGKGVKNKVLKGVREKGGKVYAPKLD